MLTSPRRMKRSKNEIEGRIDGGREGGGGGGGGGWRYTGKGGEREGRVGALIRSVQIEPGFPPNSDWQ